MGKGGDIFWDKAMFRRTLGRWAMSAREAKSTRTSVLRQQSMRAKALKTHLDELIHVADDRLALPQEGSSTFPRPHNADWAWRPELWRTGFSQKGVVGVTNQTKIGNDVTVFHDCNRSEISLRQIRNTSKADIAPFGVRVDIFGFSGSLLSLVLDLPDETTNSLNRNHILMVNSILELERPVEVFARLNIQHGPNTEQLVREMPISKNLVSAEFDLAYANLKDRRIKKAWIDLIFDDPSMNQFTFRDLTFNRRPRAQI